MKIFITGGTGVLGKRLSSELVRRGHEVVATVRDERGKATVAGAGARPVIVDLFDAEALARAAEGCEVVVHGATKIPTKTRTSAADWRANDSLRREGTLSLASAAGRIGAKLYIQQSVVWAVRPKGCEAFDESSLSIARGVYVSARDGEEIAADAAARFGFGLSILRCGMFYGAETSHTQLMGRELRRRRLPIIGSGATLWSVVHHDDVASAFATVAEARQAGTYHVVDEQPVSMRDFLREMARRLGAPAPFSVPRLVARLGVDSRVWPAVAQNTVTSSDKLRRELGWKPAYRTYVEGLAQVAEALGKN